MFIVGCFTGLSALLSFVALCHAHVVYKKVKELRELTERHGQIIALTEEDIRRVAQALSAEFNEHKH